MIIPHEFKLLVHTWRVEHVDGEIAVPGEPGETCNGLCEFDKLTIRVNTAPSRPLTLVQHTFLHEVMHAVLWSLGHKLCEDEGFVDSVAGALAQVLETSVECDTTQLPLFI